MAAAAPDQRFLSEGVRVSSPSVVYRDDCIEAEYEYHTVDVRGAEAVPRTERLTFRTSTAVPKLGVMLVGWGGNNGTTATAGVLANRLALSWATREGVRSADYLGSISQCATVRLGSDPTTGAAVHVPLGKMLPMVHPNDVVLGGWDISGANLYDAMVRAQVLHVDLQRQLRPHMEGLRPLPAAFDPSFVAANQAERADNVLQGTREQQLEQLRANIRDFQAANALDKVIVVWTANTERFCELAEGVHDSAANLLRAVSADHAEVSPSTLYGIASVLEGCSFINGSPQNTVVPGLVQLAQQRGVFVGGDDFKSGQTKMKSVLVDFLVGAGIKPVSIVSYNHLGNNDGKNLSAPATFRSKEVSKTNVVDDMVGSNRLLYKEGEHPDHCVVIKYVPQVGDSKRAMDEYSSRIFMGGLNTIAIHNTCEDSLLATPLIYDLVLFTELFERMSVRRHGESEFERFDTVLSILSYMLKAPLVPAGTPVVNALFAQRQAIINIFRAALGLPPDNSIMLEHRLPSYIAEGRGHKRVKPEGPSLVAEASAASDVDENKQEAPMEQPKRARV